MNMRAIPPATMRAITRRFIDPKQFRPLFESNPQITSFLDHFERVEGLFEQMRKAPQAADQPKIEALQAKRDHLEAEHDRTVWLIAATIETGRRSRKPERREAAELLEAVFFPNGRAFLRTKIINKVGVAHNTTSRMSRADLAAMKMLSCADGTVDELNDERMNIIGDLEATSYELEVLLGTSSKDGIAPGVVQLEWTRVVRAFDSMLALESEELRDRLMADIREAQERTRRRLAGSGDEGPSTVDVPVDDPSADDPVVLVDDPPDPSEVTS